MDGQRMPPNKIWAIIFICFVSPDILLRADHENYTVFCVRHISFIFLFCSSHLRSYTLKITCSSRTIKSKLSSVCVRVGMLDTIIIVTDPDDKSLSARLYYWKKYNLVHTRERERERDRDNLVSKIWIRRAVVSSQAHKIIKETPPQIVIILYLPLNYTDKCS